MSRMSRMSEDARLLEIQRRAFERQFGSLESMGFQDKTKQRGESGSESESESESEPGQQGSESESGQEDNESESEQNSDSDSENESDSELAPPRVIRFNGPADHYVPPSKSEQRQLRSGKPLRSNKPLRATAAAKQLPDDELEQQNLQNDIELQRFLQESNLLSALDTDDAHSGKARSRTLEMRLRELSATNARETNKLEKMPIQIRKGMVAKHLQRIKKHEHDAREGGVVLSSVKRGHFRKIDKTYRNDIERRIGTTIKKKQSLASKPRQRGLKINAVGKSTRNGLVIAKHEIARINGNKRLK